MGCHGKVLSHTIDIIQTTSKLSLLKGKIVLMHPQSTCPTQPHFHIFLRFMSFMTFLTLIKFHVTIDISWNINEALVSPLSSLHRQ
jgi:hypothetical protein